MTESSAIKLIKRAEWGGLSPFVSNDKLTLPVADVIFTYTGTDDCITTDECKDSVRKAYQRDRTEKNLPDIAHNFLIGGDESVYEGRGVEFKIEKDPDYPDLEGKSLNIGLVGNYISHNPNWILAETSKNFINQLISDNRLVKNYTAYWKQAKMDNRFFTQCENPFKEIYEQNHPNEEEEDEKLVAQDFSNHMLYKDRVKKCGPDKEPMPKNW